MSRRAKKWTISLAVVAVIAGLCVLVFRDERPPDVSDLMPRRAAVPDEQNALPLLLKAANLMVWEESHDDALRDLDAKPDALYVRKILAENEAALAAVDEALRRPKLHFEEYTLPAQALDYLSYFMHLSRLQAARSWLSAHDGDERQALEQAMALAQFGSRVKTGDGVLIHWLVGISIEAVALDGINQLVGRTSLPSEELKVFAERLAPSDKEAAAFAETMRAEFKFFTVSAELAAADPSAAGLYSGEAVPPPVAILARAAYQPNRTRRMAAVFFREVIVAARHPFGEYPAHTPALQASFERDPRMVLLSPNATGNFITRASLPVYETLVKRTALTSTRIGMTRALIGLRCHWLDHGTLPERLDDLVPEYLSGVPLDNFDGQPLRYSREKRALWSIGEDLIDSGGASNPEDNKQQKSEPTIRLDWAGEKGDLPPQRSAN